MEFAQGACVPYPFNFVGAVYVSSVCRRCPLYHKGQPQQARIYFWEHFSNLIFVTRRPRSVDTNKNSCDLSGSVEAHFCLLLLCKMHFNSSKTLLSGDIYFSSHILAVAIFLAVVLFHFVFFKKNCSSKSYCFFCVSLIIFSGVARQILSSSFLNNSFTYFKSSIVNLKAFWIVMQLTRNRYCRFF